MSTSHNSRNKNILSETKTCWKSAELYINYYLVSVGYETFMPSIGGGEIDLIAHKDGKLYRIQIKAVTPKSDFIVINSSRNSINPYGKNKSKPYENIDVLLVFDGSHIYNIPFSGQQYTTLRYTKPSTNIMCKMASDYILKDSLE
jgi:Holliday junction resolvase-like predicted endonuclease